MTNTETESSRRRNTDLSRQVSTWLDAQEPNKEFIVHDISTELGVPNSSVNGALARLVTSGILDYVGKTGRHKLFRKRARRRHIVTNDTHPSLSPSPAAIEASFENIARALPDDVLLRELARRLTK